MLGDHSKQLHQARMLRPAQRIHADIPEWHVLSLLRDWRWYSVLPSKRPVDGKVLQRQHQRSVWLPGSSSAWILRLFGGLSGLSSQRTVLTPLTMNMRGWSNRQTSARDRHLGPNGNSASIPPKTGLADLQSRASFAHRVVNPFIFRCLRIASECGHLRWTRSGVGATNG